MQSLSCAIAFFYSPYLSLPWQLLITVVLDVLGSVAFCLVEWEARNRTKEAAPEDTPEDTSCALPAATEDP